MVADAGVMRMRGSERATRDGVVEVTLSLVYWLSRCRRRAPTHCMKNHRRGGVSGNVVVHHRQRDAVEGRARSSRVGSHCAYPSGVSE